MSKIVRRKFIAVSAAAALVMLVPIAALAQSSASKNKAVCQVSDADPQKWNLALNNVGNVQDDLGGDKVDLEIVVYGPGIGMLKADSLVAKRIADALESGVKFVACENTRKAEGAEAGPCRHASRHRLHTGRRGGTDPEAATGVRLHPPLTRDSRPARHYPFGLSPITRCGNRPRPRQRR